jgi:hypothetical protein
MDRESYNACMKPYMSTPGTREERRQAMCVGAKLCTGKAQDQTTAQKLCAEAQAKKAAETPEKPRKRRKKETAACPASSTCPPCDCGKVDTELAICELTLWRMQTTQEAMEKVSEAVMAGNWDRATQIVTKYMKEQAE